MNYSICTKDQPDVHKEFMACEQRVNWNVYEIAHKDAANGFIVQIVLRTSTIDSDEHIYHYYEAWEVINGICDPLFDKTPDYCDDAFCIGARLLGGGYDWEQALIQSIGHHGKEEWVCKVCWIDKHDHASLYKTIFDWPTEEVDQANGLRAVWVTAENKEMFSSVHQLIRPPFVHSWDMRSTEKIKYVTKEYLFKQCKNNKSEAERRNFEILLLDFFKDEKYSFIMNELREEWYSQ